MNSRVHPRLSLAVALAVALLSGTRGTASADYALTIESPFLAPIPGAPLLEVLRTVPNVVGRASADARAAVEALGLRVLWAGEPAGAAVTAQSPAAGTRVAAGTTVRLTVSASAPPPAATVVVPSVLGMRRSGALSVLRGAGLTARFIPDLATGAVTGQTPAAGTRVAPGSEVRVTLR